MILEAARGLEYAHRKEIIHRDVKPDNFMLGEGGMIKIGDLGLAQRLGEKLSADNDDTVIGTPHYIAPEQVLGRPADVRSDVYSLGSTMYRMIAGFTPFQAPSVRELVNRKAREEANPLHLALGGIPESLSLICAKMMKRQPEERTQTMTEVIAELEAWTRDANGSTPAAREAPPVNRRLLVTAVGLLGVVVIGGVIAATAMLKKAPPSTTPPNPAIAEPADDAGNAGREIRSAATAESKLDDRKPDDFEEVIRMFDAIATRWPGTAYAKDSERRREELKTRRLGLMATRGLGALDELDRESWKTLVQTFAGGREDLSEAEKRIQAFRAFADDPAWKGTEASVAAGRRAATISMWLAEVQKRRAGYEKLKGDTEKLASVQRFLEAWEACNEFISEIAAFPPASKDRYSTLLFDVPARRPRDRRPGQELLMPRAGAAARAKAAAAVPWNLGPPPPKIRPTSRALVEEIHWRWSAANQEAQGLGAQVQLANLDAGRFQKVAARATVPRRSEGAAPADAAGDRSTPDCFGGAAARASRPTAAPTAEFRTC
jgi:hypothetical protein